VAYITLFNYLMEFINIYIFLGYFNVQLIFGLSVYQTPQKSFIKMNIRQRTMTNDFMS
jgi:hypothetical protein